MGVGGGMHFIWERGEGGTLYGKGGGYMGWLLYMSRGGGGGMAISYGQGGGGNPGVATLYGQGDAWASCFI